jgi:hypothetical protein
MVISSAPTIAVPVRRRWLTVSLANVIVNRADGVTALAALFRGGLEPMRSAGQLPEPARGWRLRRPDRFTAVLLGPGGDVAYRGPCVQPEEWAQLVDAAGACVVLAGTIGLYAVPGGELTTRRARRLLDQAARDGGLAGGLIACWPGDVPGAGRVPPGATLPDRIRRGWVRRS